MSNLELELIDVHNYSREKHILYELAEKIWTNPESLENIKHSINRWGMTKTESGEYFYIKLDGERVGLTGYFIPDITRGIFGLRHHGTLIKGTGRLALDVLVNYLKEKYSEFDCLIELVPEGKEDLIKKFENWGFILTPDGVPDWEPKKDYYKYAMIRRG